MQTEKIKKIIEETMAINTHCHHYRNDFFEDLDLDKLLKNSYANWCGVSFDDSMQSKQEYLDYIRYNSYFVWLQKSLKKIYQIEENLTVENWELYSNKIRTAHRDHEWHKNVLRDFCRYEHVILDTRWDPGSNNDEPGIFASTFRVDPLFFGFSRDRTDHDGNNAFKFYKKEFSDLDTYLAFVSDLITQKIKGGCVSLKCAIAYDRTLDFKAVTKEEAEAVFLDKDMSETNIKNFQDYLFHHICRVAAKLNVPLQCHTGLGCLSGTSAIQLQQTIKRHPDTKFVLFHGSYPWTDDLLGLLHVYPNVYADICWLPLISPSAAVHALHQLIEVGTADKVCWGCDTWTSEESFGARIAVNHVLEEVLVKKIDDGYLGFDDAVKLIKRILYLNPKQLYQFD